MSVRPFRMAASVFFSFLSSLADVPLYVDSLVDFFRFPSTPPPLAFFFLLFSFLRGGFLASLLWFFLFATSHSAFFCLSFGLFLSFLQVLPPEHPQAESLCTQGLSCHWFLGTASLTCRSAPHGSAVPNHETSLRLSRFWKIRRIDGLQPLFVPFFLPLPFFSRHSPHRRRYLFLCLKWRSQKNTLPMFNSKCDPPLPFFTTTVRLSLL